MKKKTSKEIIHDLFVKDRSKSNGYTVKRIESITGLRKSQVYRIIAQLKRELWDINALILYSVSRKRGYIILGSAEDKVKVILQMKNRTNGHIYNMQRVIDSAGLHENFMPLLDKLNTLDKYESIDTENKTKPTQREKNNKQLG